MLTRYPLKKPLTSSTLVSTASQVNSLYVPFNGCARRLVGAYRGSVHTMQLSNYHSLHSSEELL